MEIMTEQFMKSITDKIFAFNNIRPNTEPVYGTLERFNEEGDVKDPRIQDAPSIMSLGSA